MKRVKKILSFVLAVVLLVLSMTTCVSAASKVTTVKEISQGTGTAIKYLQRNVGLIKKWGIIPGLMQTVTRTSDDKNVTTCNGMVPQGITFGGDFLFISAYCGCGKEHRSVIYVIGASDRKYKSTLILDTSCHVGGIAKAGNYIWVCDSDYKCLRAYKYSSACDANGRAYMTVKTQAKCSVATTPSYLCYANGYLYVGTHYKDSTTAKIYYYSISGKNISPKGYFKISGVSKIQGLSIRGEYMVVASSYGRSNKSNVYVFRDSSKFVTDKKVYSSPIKTFKFANMVEGCYIGSSYTYFIFESGAKTYRSSANTMPLDKYVAFSNSTMGIKK